MITRSILVADEDSDTRVILRAVLEREQFVVAEAASADEALAAFQQHTPDLVIFNYPMSGRDGRSLVHHLRTQPAGAGVPVLNLTSRVVPQLLQEAAADGVNLSVSKPMDVEVLVRIVGELMESPTAKANAR